MKTIKYIYFTYKGDEQHVVESVKCLRRAEPTAPIVIADDCFAPICEEMKNTLVDELKCGYRQTEYNRNGNLLGPENLIGQTQFLEHEGVDVDVIVKVDADTMLIDTKWVYEFAEKEKPVIAGVVQRNNHHWIYGMAYAIKTKDCLSLLVRDALLVRAHRDAFEDYEVSTRLYRLSYYHTDFADRHVMGTESGFILSTLAGANESFANARVCNFGYDLQSTPPRERAAYKAKQLELMRKINTILEERAQGQGVAK